MKKERKRADEAFSFVGATIFLLLSAFAMVGFMFVAYHFLNWVDTQVVTETELAEHDCVGAKKEWLHLTDECYESITWFYTGPNSFPTSSPPLQVIR